VKPDLRRVVSVDDATVVDRVLGRLDAVLVLSLARGDVSDYCDDRRVFPPSCLSVDSTR